MMPCVATPKTALTFLVTFPVHDGIVDLKGKAKDRKVRVLLFGALLRRLLTIPRITRRGALSERRRMYRLSLSSCRQLLGDHQEGTSQ